MATSLVRHALCSVRDVKLRLDETMGTTKDELLISLINSISTHAQDRTGREFEIKARTKLFDGPIGTLALPAYPVDSAETFEVFADRERAFAAATELTLNTNFTVDYPEGIIHYLGTNIFDAGFGGTRLFTPQMRGQGLGYGPQSIKVNWTGGIITPTPAAPALPSVADDGAGVLTGIFRWRIAKYTTATGIETAATASVTLELAAKKALLGFANPGVGAETRIYRTGASENESFYLATVAGTSGGAQTYSDNNLDAVLDTTISAPEAGPLVVPEGLRGAAASQVAHWYKNRNDDARVQQSQSMGGSIIFTRDGKPLLPFVTSAICEYARI